MKRSTPLKRTPFRRRSAGTGNSLGAEPGQKLEGGGASGSRRPPKARKPLKQKSAKRRAMADAEWDFRHAVMRRDGGRCQWPEWPDICGEDATDVHHRCQRSTHPSRATCVTAAISLCRFHHDLIDTADGQAKAFANGMLFHSWEEPPCHCQPPCPGTLEAVDRGR